MNILYQQSKENKMLFLWIKYSSLLEPQPHVLQNIKGNTFCLLLLCLPQKN